METRDKVPGVKGIRISPTRLGLSRLGFRALGFTLF